MVWGAFMFIDSIKLMINSINFRVVNNNFCEHYIFYVDVNNKIYKLWINISNKTN